MHLGESRVSKWYEYFSRKFVLTLLALMGAFYLVLNGHPLGEFTAALVVILGFYQAANVAQDAIASKSHSSNTEKSD